VTFRFSMPASGPVRLGLYDVAGRLVRMSLDAELDAGEYQHGMTLADVKPGIYFGVLRARGGEARRSIVVAR
jgi:hypothetical protein